MSTLWKRVSDVTVTRFLRMGKNAVIKITNANGTESTIDLTELAALDAISATDLAKIDGITNGTIAAGKAVVVDSNKDAGDFRNLDAVNIDAGASGTAGTVDVFPTTASKGKFILSCTDQDGDTNVTLKPAAMGQASVVSIPDPGAATANVLLTDAANDGVVVTATAAEINSACDQSANVLTAGAGITDGSSTVYKTAIQKVGDLFKTTIYIDLTDLQSSTTDLDVIGTGASAAHIGQITAAKNGTIFAGQVTCIETPATGVTDIDLYSATEGTGAFDSAVADLTETALLTKGGAWTAAVATPVTLSAFPAADEYLYLTGGAAGTVGTYTAGRFIIELWGV